MACSELLPNSEPAESRKLKIVHQQVENPFATLVSGQTIAIIPSFTLESGLTLYNVPLSYTVRGNLSPERDNAMVICHAFSGSADVSDWWGPMLGPGRALDFTKFYVICMNSLGSPYGSASPVTYRDGDPKKGIYGPEFPPTTIRDDVNFHKILLDELGVKQITAVIGGSMGGMLVLEWAYFGKDYVRCIIPIATSSHHSAWGISWGEAQRQCIYADPKYNDGYYSFADPPTTGLGAARMSALLTYRSRNSFEARFGRKTQDISQAFSSSQRLSPGQIYLAIHNEGHTSQRNMNKNSLPLGDGKKQEDHISNSNDFKLCDDSTLVSDRILSPENSKPVPTFFSAQSYLRYKGTKFVERFDSNCYISITRKLDTHDISRSRTSSISSALALIEQPTLVIGIESDGLFTFTEQIELASGIPNAKLARIESMEGHDAFFLQYEQVNTHIVKFLKETFPDKMKSEKNEDIEHSELNSVAKETYLQDNILDDITAW